MTEQRRERQERRLEVQSGLRFELCIAMILQNATRNVNKFRATVPGPARAKRMVSMRVRGYCTTVNKSLPGSHDMHNNNLQMTFWGLNESWQSIEAIEELMNRHQRELAKTQRDASPHLSVTAPLD